MSSAHNRIMKKLSCLHSVHRHPQFVCSSCSIHGLYRQFSLFLFVIIHVLEGTFVRLSVFLSFIIFFLFFRCVLLYFCTTCPCVPLFLCFQSLSVLSLCFLSLSFSISPCLCLSVSAFSLYPSVCLPFCLIFQSLSLLLLPFCLILQSLSLRVSDVLSYISVSIPQCH